MNGIVRLFRNKSDIENLSRLRTSLPTGVDPVDYKNVVVNKPWGYEYLIFENRNVAIWVLFLKPRHKTSMHCHPNKKTSLLVLSGSVQCSGLEGWYDRTPGEGVFIEEAVFHSTVATSPEGAFIIEIESPPNKKDLVRLKDEYGRALTGYEGSSFITSDTTSYEYFDFHSKDTHMLRTCSMSIHNKTSPKNLHTLLSRTACSIISLLSGKFLDKEGNVLLSAGESISWADLKDILKIYAFGDITYLTLKFR